MMGNTFNFEEEAFETPDFNVPEMTTRAQKMQEDGQVGKNEIRLLASIKGFFMQSRQSAETLAEATRKKPEAMRKINAALGAIYAITAVAQKMTLQPEDEEGKREKQLNAMWEQESNLSEAEKLTVKSAESKIHSKIGVRLRISEKELLDKKQLEMFEAQDRYLMAYADLYQKFEDSSEVQSLSTSNEKDEKINEMVIEAIDDGVLRDVKSTETAYLALVEKYMGYGTARIALHYLQQLWEGLKSAPMEIITACMTGIKNIAKLCIAIPYTCCVIVALGLGYIPKTILNTAKSLVVDILTIGDKMIGHAFLKLAKFFGLSDDTYNRVAGKTVKEAGKEIWSNCVEEFQASIERSNNQTMMLLSNIFKGERFSSSGYKVEGRTKEEADDSFLAFLKNLTASVGTMFQLTGAKGAKDTAQAIVGSVIHAPGHAFANAKKQFKGEGNDRKPTGRGPDSLGSDSRYRR